jgi:hypothetical protein
MKYQDDSANKFVNAFPVGVRTGTNTQDAANPDDDGYDFLRGVEHVGTVTFDDGAGAYNPVPEEDDEPGETP